MVNSQPSDVADLILVSLQLVASCSRVASPVQQWERWDDSVARRMPCLWSLRYMGWDEAVVVATVCESDIGELFRWLHRPTLWLDPVRSGWTIGLPDGGRVSGASVAVVGAGLGGLTAALSLLHAGFDVRVYEQASSLTEVGAGIQVSPNASRVLHRLGLAGELARTGVKPAAWHQRRWDDGRTLLRSPLGDLLEARFGYPHYQMHRADLLSALSKAFPDDRVHLQHRFTSCEQTPDSVELRFANGQAVRAHVVVGADGIHSAVRGQLFGAQSPRFTGCTAYRGLVRAERLTELDLEVTAQIWMGPGRHFVHYFVSNKRLVNFVAVVERDSWTGESWTDRADAAEAVAAFEGWHPQVRTILRAVDQVYIWALFDRAPMRQWSVGRVTLLGDACHAMLPFMAQGAAQAIEDGATLAACLGRGERDIPDALRRYEQLRMPRTARMQALSTQNKLRFHLVDGPQQRDRDAQMAAGATDWSFEAVAWMYEHDATLPAAADHSG